MSEYQLGQIVFMDKIQIEVRKMKINALCSNKIYITIMMIVKMHSMHEIQKTMISQI